MNKAKKRKNKKKAREAGQIVSYFLGVGKVQGISQVFLHEVFVDKKDNQVGLVIGFDEKYIEVLFFQDRFPLDTKLYRSKKKFSILVSKATIGRVVNGLGQQRDGLGPVTGRKRPVFSRAPAIVERQPVSDPLTTGIKMIDTTLSLGRGQRELIIGDRKLGKSALALDTVINQKHAETPVYCIYVVCGQKRRKLEETISLFEKNNTFLHTVVVAATAEDSYAAQYLAPFVGCAIGEYFRSLGKDALVVYDDLSKHAKVYRSISLLLERAPGRESYPGDIFSLHAALLERAARLSKKNGGGSLTALPIIETQEGDITSFIPTNIISITDGQIYLERALFQKGFRPAVNVGLSVSRVGGKAQPVPLREVVGGIRLALSQHKELQKLTQLETVVSEKAKKKIHRGDLTLELLKQQKHTCISWPEQVVLFYAVEEGFFDDMEKDDWSNFEDMLLQLLRNRFAKVVNHIRSKPWNSARKKEIQKIIANAKKEFLAQ